MRLFLIFAVAALVRIAPARAQSSRDVRSLSLGGSEVADSRSSGQTNPAFFTSDSSAAIWTRFTPTANYIDGAFEATGGASVPVGRLQIGCAFDHLGYEDIYAFNEASLDVSAAVGGERFGLGGIRLRYAHEAYGETIAPVNSVSVDLGVSVQPAEDLHLGVDVLDVISGVQRPSAFDLGLGYSIDRSMLLASARLLDDRLGFAFGAEVPIAPAIVLRAATSTSTHLVTGGVTFRYTGFNFDLGFAEHPDLGSSLSFGVRWQDL